jgi:hypothetical protein
MDVDALGGILMNFVSKVWSSTPDIRHTFQRNATLKFNFLQSWLMSHACGYENWALETT